MRYDAKGMPYRRRRTLKPGERLSSWANVKYDDENLLWVHTDIDLHSESIRLVGWAIAKAMNVRIA